MDQSATQFPISVMLTCKNVKRSIEFYRDVLGFELKEVWPDVDQAKWANMVLDGQSVMLGSVMTPEAAAQMCGEDAGAVQYMKTLAEEFRTNRPGVGICTYVMVKDVDAYHAKVAPKLGKSCGKPKSQFYGLRDFGVEDPDGYRFLFYVPIKLANCQSCGMPLADAKPGEMYCRYCVDERGHLKSFDVILEGTAEYFMSSQKMPRDVALKTAREHLMKMPAWMTRK